MPSTLLAIVDIVESEELTLEALLPSVCIKFNRLLASTKNCKVLLPSICVVTLAVFLLTVSCNFSSSISHVPETVLEEMEVEKEPSDSNVMVELLVKPAFVRTLDNFSSILLDATLPAVLDSMLSLSNTIAGSEYFQVPTIFFSVAVFDEENIDVMADITLLAVDELDELEELEEDEELETLSLTVLRISLI